MTEQQIAKLVATLVEHQWGFTPLSKEDAQWVIQNTKDAIGLFNKAIRLRQNLSDGERCAMQEHIKILYEIRASQEVVAAAIKMAKFYGVPMPLVGTVVKTIHVNPYEAKDMNEAFKLGKFDDGNGDPDRLFEDEVMGLAEAVDIQLVQFDRPNYDDILAWAKENGKKPILPRHLFGIGIQFVNQRFNAIIIELGSIRRGLALSFNDAIWDWRYIQYSSVLEMHQARLFGFIVE